MIEIDGSVGGGQLVRTALSLSALSGEPFRMEGIRRERPNPGLRPQHLAGVEVVAAATDAEVTGADAGSETLEFSPGPVRPGRHEVDVGTAGSLSLLFDTVLPLACALDGATVLRARGGTDVRWAPTMAYLRRVKLPLLRGLGFAGAVDVDRRGFYPAGGGESTLFLAGSNLEPIELERTGPPDDVRVFSVASTDLADREVAERQAGRATDALGELDLEVTGRTVEYAPASSPGSAVTLRVTGGGVVAGADVLGERGKPAERVAAEAVEGIRAGLDAGGAVDEHLADQLLVFLAVAGGRVAIPRVTDHVETSLVVLRRFGHDVRLDEDVDPPVLST